MDLINAIVKRFPLAAIAEEVKRTTGKDIGDNAQLGAAVIGTNLRNMEHAVATFHDLYQGCGSAEDIQSLMDIAYPGCSPKQAAHHLCRFRNPAKYRPKVTPHYAVTGGRGGRVNSAAVNLSDKLAASLAAFLK